MHKQKLYFLFRAHSHILLSIAVSLSFSISLLPLSLSSSSAGPAMSFFLLFPPLPPFVTPLIIPNPPLLSPLHPFCTHPSHFYLIQMIFSVSCALVFCLLLSPSPPTWMKDGSESSASPLSPPPHIRPKPSLMFLNANPFTFQAPTSPVPTFGKVYNGNFPS